MSASHVALHSVTRRPYRIDATVTVSKSPLDGLGSVMVVKRQRTVSEQGAPADNVYKVVSGALRTVRLLPDGRRHVANFLLPGDFFGLAEHDEYTHSVEAVADTTVIRYPRPAIERLLLTSGPASRHLLGLVCGQLSAAQDRLLLLGRKSAIERLATFLLALADRESSNRTRATAVDLPMNRGDIADYLGMTVETVSRVLTYLRRRRIIQIENVNRIVFLRRDALEDLSLGEA